MSMATPLSPLEQRYKEDVKITSDYPPRIGGARIPAFDGELVSCNIK